MWALSIFGSFTSPTSRFVASILIALAAPGFGCDDGSGSSSDAPVGGTSGAAGGAAAMGGLSASAGAETTEGAGTAGVPTAPLASGYSTWTYNGQPVGLYLPETTQSPLPIVMFLHSCGNSPLSENFWIISALNQVEPCAVFLPYRPAAESAECAAWGGTYDETIRPGLRDAVAELDRLVNDYDFDTTRQYVYGESMGGEGVFRLLFDQPTRFAGAIAVAGYTVDKGASQMAQTPLWILHGENDSISPVESARTIHQSILDAGGTQVRYTEYAGLDHVPAIEEARRHPELLTWLLEQRR